MITVAVAAFDGVLEKRAHASCRIILYRYLYTYASSNVMPSCAAPMNIVFQRRFWMVESFTSDMIPLGRHHGMS